MAITAQTLLDEAQCFMCFGAVSTSQALWLALIRRILIRLNPSSDTSAQTLLNYARCFGCYSDASQVDMMGLAMLDKIAALSPVQSFLSRTGISDPTQVAALTQLLISAQDHGWWDKCDLIYPFVGGNANAHAQNFKSSSFTITWHGTITHDANGITGDGATGYGDTGYNLLSSGQYIKDSAHGSVYRRSNGTVNSNAYCGSISGNGFELTRGFATQTRGQVNDGGPSTVVSTAGRLLTATRLDAATKHIYLNGVDNSFATVSLAPPSSLLFILALSNGGVTTNFSDANLACLTLGSGIDFATYQLMAADWQTFETSLGRQV